MADYSKLLMDGEQMRVVTRPHWKFIIAGVCIAAVTFPVLILLLAWSSSSLGGLSKWVNLVIALVALIILIRWTAKPILEWAFTRYYFTTRRVMTRSGIISRKAADIPLDMVSNVYYDQGVLDRFLKCGVVRLDSSGGDGFTLNNVPHVEELTRTLHELVDEAKDEN